ncbi:Hint domain-containing protein [Aliiruegeria haliotis]|uniref:Hint domain-containing protein n=1 Tax=Aliiruegeria haliotis TaxID=1280846 RepID=A0A2T0RJ21_9RHOB|nr:Hint domain-containing protein [Aliiruegeria haliotis]PRY21185.1 Hint domain-containing protein [Aliiruegeria haliotis]
MLDWIAEAVGMRDSREDTGPQPLAPECGLVAGTLVATTTGWRPVEALCVGDEVLTFDDGVQVVKGVTRRLYPMNQKARASVRPLLSVPAGMIGNRRPLLTLAGQALVIESDLAEELLGDPFAPVQAMRLDGAQGVRRVLPEEAVVVVTLGFEQDQVIFIEGNALAICEAAEIAMPATVEEAMWAEPNTRYPVLSAEDANSVVAGLDFADSSFAQTHTGTRPAHLS